MPIFVDPSELRENSLFPSSLQCIPCEGLEAATGADFVISRLPISPVAALPLHIKSRSLFCQRKSGYDALNFTQIDLEIARFQSLSIPMQQAFILPIGKFYPNESGYLRVEGKRPVQNNETIAYLTYLKLEAEWGYSGLQVRRLNDETELEIFIQAQQEELQRIEDRNGKKEVAVRGTPFVPDDPFQTISEVEDFLLCGLKGFGQKTLLNLKSYIEDNLNHLWYSGYFALKVLSEEDEKGKPVHNIAGWGEKSRKRLREILGLPKGYNLSIEENGELKRPYVEGWYASLDAFKLLLEDNPKKKSAAEIWQQIRNEEIPF